MSDVSSILRPGVYAPVLTPFTNNKEQEVDVAAFRAGILRLAKAGIGLVLSGTLGEATLLSRDERATLIHHAREVLVQNGLDKKIPIIAGVGAGSLKETIAYAHDAGSKGADAA